MSVSVWNADEGYLIPVSLSNNYACIFAMIMVVLIQSFREKMTTYSRCELNPD
jgi:hypothetical protein